MKFELEGGSHTEVRFYHDKKGKMHAFPSGNAKLIHDKGTPEAKKAFRQIMEYDESLWSESTIELILRWIKIKMRGLVHNA